MGVFQRFFFLLLAARLLGGALGAAGQAPPAQLPVSAYTLVASTGPYVVQNLAYQVRDIQQDDNDSRPLPIGFSFQFADQVSTQFVVSSNGFMQLLSGGELSPFRDNLNGNMGRATYDVRGVAPNRVLVMQWQNWRWPSTAFVNPPGAPSVDVVTLSFQVKLYETTNVVQFCYQREAAVPFPTTNLAARIGLEGAGGFLSLNNASAAPTASSTVQTNTITQRPATGQIYTFTPPTPCPALAAATAAATGFTTATVGFAAAPGSRYLVRYTEHPFGTVYREVTATAGPVPLTGLVANTGYRAEVHRLCPNGAVSLPVTALFNTPPLPNPTATWTGASSTAWATPANWNPPALPTATTDVTVPPVPNPPTVAGPQVCGGLALRAGATLTLAPALGAVPAGYLTTSGTVVLAAGSTVRQAAGTTLSVGFNFTNNGAALVLDPASALAFENGGALGGTAPTALQNLTVGAVLPGTQITIEAPVQVQRLVRLLQQAALDVVPAAGGSLRLLSNAQGTAQVLGDGFAVGPVTVERTLPASTAGGVAGVGRHYYAPAVISRPLAALAAPGFAPVLNVDYNTSATPATTTPFPTVFAYDQGRISTNVNGLEDFETGFYSPALPTEVMVGGAGYRLDVPGAVTLAVTGQLRLSTAQRSLLTRATLPQSGYHLVGNPFPAAIMWDSVRLARNTTGLDAAVYVYQSAGAGAGTFRAYVNGVGAPRYLPPGQAFFVRVSGPSIPANVSIPAAARYQNYYDPAAPPAAPADLRPLVRLTLAAPTGPIDEATVYFQTGATAGFDRLFDAHKLPTGGVPSVAFAGTSPLAISGLPPLGAADVVLPLAVWVPASGAYSLAFSLRNLPAGQYAYLRDALTGAATDLAVQPAVPFTMSAAASGPRFTLVLTRTRILATAPAALAQQITLFPNPAKGVAWLELPAALHGQALTAEVRNVLGAVVRTARLPAGAGVRAVPLAGLAPGVYTVRLATGQGTVARRLVVE